MKIDSYDKCTIYKWRYQTWQYVNRRGRISSSFWISRKISRVASRRSNRHIIFWWVYWYVSLKKSNEYAAEIIGRKGTLRKSSKFYNWADTNRGEIRKCWALLLHMECINLPTIAHYWNKNNFYNLPFWRTHMCRIRFEL